MIKIMNQKTLLERLEPIIKILKQCEQMFFSTLSFVTKNINSSSNEIDQLTIFNNFLSLQNLKQTQFEQQQHQFLANFQVITEQENEKYYTTTSKQIVRLAARIIEMIETSLERSQNTLFNQNGKINIDFVRLKRRIQEMIQQDQIQLLQFVTSILNFAKHKYKRQIVKIEKYINQLKSGEHITFLDLYKKEDLEKQIKQKNREKYSVQKSKKQNNINNAISQCKIIKGGSLKKRDGSKIKRVLKIKDSKKEEARSFHETQKQKMSKSATASHLLRIYSVIDLSKKDFLDDFVFPLKDQQKQKQTIMSQLLQKNKLNANQIKQFRENCQFFKPNIELASFKKTIQQHKKNEQSDLSFNNKNGLKTNFIISKRKQSFTYESISEKSVIQITQQEKQFSMTVKNLVNKKRKSQQKPKQTSKNKKVLMAKVPLMFEDNLIPRNQISKNSWVTTPLTMREKQTVKKYQNIRLKKNNNPVILQDQIQLFRFNQNLL